MPLDTSCPPIASDRLGPCHVNPQPPAGAIESDGPRRLKAVPIAFQPETNISVVDKNESARSGRS
jgi:hypothetical protein